LHKWKNSVTVVAKLDTSHCNAVSKTNQKLNGILTKATQASKTETKTSKLTPASNNKQSTQNKGEGWIRVHSQLYQ
jgi:hypothetical protein